MGCRGMKEGVLYFLCQECLGDLEYKGADYLCESCGCVEAGRAIMTRKSSENAFQVLDSSYTRERINGEGMIKKRDEKSALQDIVHVLETLLKLASIYVAVTIFLTLLIWWKVLNIASDVHLLQRRTNPVLNSPTPGYPR